MRLVLKSSDGKNQIVTYFSEAWMVREWIFSKVFPSPSHDAWTTALP